MFNMLKNIDLRGGKTQEHVISDIRTSVLKPQGTHDYFKHCMEKEDEEGKEKKNQRGSTRYKTQMWRTKRNERSERDEGEQKIEEKDKEEGKKIIRSVNL